MEAALVDLLGEGVAPGLQHLCVPAEQVAHILTNLELQPGWNSAAFGALLLGGAPNQLEDKVEVEVDTAPWLGLASILK